jgi:hypothetical protein
MLVTTVKLVNNSKVLLLEDFFPSPLIDKLLDLCDTHPDPTTWTTPFGFDDTAIRRSYTGRSPIIIETEQWLGSSDCLSILEKHIGKSLSYSDMHLWCDSTGVESMKPHKEQGGEFLAQFFIARTEHSYTGTTIYNDDGRILFQMPYRNNYGWFFDQGTTVMHGREHPVPNDIKRFSLLVWYGSKISF